MDINFSKQIYINMAQESQKEECLELKKKAKEQAEHNINSITNGGQKSFLDRVNGFIKNHSNKNRNTSIDKTIDSGDDPANNAVESVDFDNEKFKIKKKFQ